MSNRKHVDLLLAELGELIELGGVKLNESGYTCLVFDSKIYVEIEYDEEIDQLVLSSNLGKPRTTEHLKVLYNRLLQRYERI